MSACPLVVLACESLHVCTVCIWRCEHTRFCVEGFYALYINFHSFIHSLQNIFLCFLVCGDRLLIFSMAVHLRSTSVWPLPLKCLATEVFLLVLMSDLWW